MTHNDPNSSKRGVGVIATMAFSNFALPFMFSGVAVTMPSMGRELAMSGATLGLFESLYLGVSAALMLPAGRIADAGDKKSFFAIGVVVFSLATFGLGLAPTSVVSLICRAFQGISGAFVAATNMALLSEHVPRQRLGQAMGFNIGAVYVGLSAGPFVAGFLTTSLGWRWMYLLSGVMALGVTTSAVVCVTPAWRRPTLIFDWWGMLVSVAGMICLIAGSATVHSSAIGFLLAGAGVCLLVGFVFVEQRVKSPLVSFSSLSARPVLRRALTVQLLTYAGAFGTSFLFALYLQEAQGWNAVEAGRLLILSPVLMACLAPVSGRLADRVRPQLIAAIGVTLICVGTVTAWFVGPTGSLYFLVITLVGHGVGFAMFSSPNMTVIMSSVPRERTGMASALASQMRTLGMVFSMMLITVFLALNLGQEGLESSHAVPGLLKTMSGALFAIGGLSVLALLVAWRDAPIPKN